MRDIYAFVIEDDDATAHKIVQILSDAGMCVGGNPTGKYSVHFCTEERYDVITLDLSLPDMDGIEVIRKLRAAKVTTPILVLTEDASVESKIKALGLGADDYMTKPFHKDELVARLKAILRGREYGATEATKFLQLLPKTGDTVSEPLASV